MIRQNWILVSAALLGTTPLGAQKPAATYIERYNEVMALAPRADRVASVSGLVLQRDIARFTLESGSLYLLTPVGGRTVAVLFKGKGTFAFAPPSPIERARLKRFSGSDALATPFTELVLIFADSTAAELERRVAFGPGAVPDRSIIERALDYQGEKKEQYFNPDLMDGLLNAEGSDIFYAHVSRAGDDPWMFMLNPWEGEGVRLLRRAKGTGYSRFAEVVCQFPRQHERAIAERDRTRHAEIRHYTLDTRLPRTGAGNIDFSATAELDITTSTPIGPWIAFYLYDKLAVDSARWDGGAPAVTFKGRENPMLWVRLPEQLAAGASRKLKVYYHGDLIDRYSEWFFIKSSAAWYPRGLEPRNAATFDLTYHTPTTYRFASAGELADSSEADGTRTTRWLSLGPMRNASFNLGRFESIELEGPGRLPLTLLYSEAGHRALGAGAAGTRGMSRQVGQDMVLSMTFFDNVFGQAPVKRFYATEIPYAHGEAFPGLVHLSAGTFGEADLQGFDEWFRAHEVAHQWWGIGVDFATYHDQWMSEGFASFAGLWYLQTVRKDNGKYFGMLDRWRADIMVRGTEPGPVWLGYRAARINDGDNDYNIIVYEKGAWVLHMLRILMLDLKTMGEDRFTNMMRDFYVTYQGQRASTDDFRRTVEKHTGNDMNWFFDQWVRSPEIPTYRVAWRTEPVEGGKFRVKLRVDQQNVPADFRMYVPVTVQLGKDQVVRARVQVRGARSDIDLPIVTSEPTAVHFNDLSGVLADVKMVGWSD